MSAEPLGAPIEGNPDSPRTPGGYTVPAEWSAWLDEPNKHEAEITTVIASLQDGLPQLSDEELRRARADIVFLKALLDDEGQAVATARAGGVFAAEP